MRRLAAVALLPALAWTPHMAAAEKFARSRDGTVTFAVRTDDQLWGRRIDRQVPSASVLKAMLLTTYLRQRSVRQRDLERADKRLLAPMIRRSDNVAATRVRDIVGNAAVVRLAHRVGMTRFVIAQVWGLSQITARDQTKYFLHIDRFIPKRHRRYAMRLLRTIVPSQRWGIAQVIPDGWRLFFKGGWGSGTGAVDHQVGLLQRGDQGVAIAVMTINSPSHDYGKATLRGVAKRLLAGLDTAP
jgi:hypothetical protein